MVTSCICDRVAGCGVPAVAAREPSADAAADATAHGAGCRVWSIARRAGQRSGRGTGPILRLILLLELAFEVRRERRLLRRMGDRELKDIGFSRSDAHAESRRPFWDLPRHRLPR